MNSLMAPVITIDGPSGAGKTDLCKKLSAKLKWYILDSGMIYRAFALMVFKKKIQISNSKIEFISFGKKIFPQKYKNLLKKFLKNKNYINQLYLQSISNLASKLSALPHVRRFLLKQQILCRKFPGLIANGRDMGTVVFPDAIIKFFLDASLKKRVERRNLEFKKKGIKIAFKNLYSEMEQRDIRDQKRIFSPLKPSKDAIIIDSSYINSQKVLDIMMTYIKKYNFL